MCGIIGIIGAPDDNIVPLLLERLHRLEYRGYDSAGVAVLQKGRCARRRAEGKLQALEEALKAAPLQGAIGIGHTRWATHGAPSARNAHPHIAGKISVVHNGIIENFRELKTELAKAGTKFTSDTDSEVIAALFAHCLRRHKSLKAAARAALKRLRGAYALALLIEGEEGMLVARRGSPLVIGYAPGRLVLGSDAYALAGLADELTYLKDGEWALLTRKGVEIFSETGRARPARRQPNDSRNLLVDKGGHRHFMAKEIFEQPDTLTHALGAYVEPALLRTTMPALPLAADKIERVVLMACGTAFYAAHIAAHWLERLAKIPASIDIASEYRYRSSPLSPDCLAIGISQSGETADTLAALGHCKAQGVPTLGIVNVESSSLAHMADVSLPILAGPEIGVASTKAFLGQLLVLLVLAIHLGRARGALSAKEERGMLESLLGLPRQLNEVLGMDAQIRDLAHTTLAHHAHALYIGRGVAHALALEGALKLKELSYIHAEGFAAGELKHGSIALIDDDMPVVVLAPETALMEKTLSNLHEARARGAQIVLISSRKGCAAARGQYRAAIAMPPMPPLLVPMLYAAPMQLLAYHTAVAKGTDVDQPRNLAKSVTVE